MKGNKNSNWPTNAKPQATPAEIGSLVGIMDDLRKLPPVSKRDSEAVRERLDYYFRHCEEQGIRPSVEGMCVALGTSRQAIWQWENDEGSEAGALISRAKATLNAIQTAWAMDGRVPFAYIIWLQKNNHKYSDVQTIEVKPQGQPIASRSAEEIASDYGMMYGSAMELGLPELPELPPN